MPRGLELTTLRPRAAHCTSCASQAPPPACHASSRSILKYTRCLASPLRGPGHSPYARSPGAPAAVPSPLHLDPRPARPWPQPTYTPLGPRHFLPPPHPPGPPAEDEQPSSRDSPTATPHGRVCTHTPMRYWACGWLTRGFFTIFPVGTFTHGGCECPTARPPRRGGLQTTCPDPGSG